MSDCMFAYTLSTASQNTQRRLRREEESEEVAIDKGVSERDTGWRSSERTVSCVFVVVSTLKPP